MAIRTGWRHDDLASMDRAASKYTPRPVTTSVEDGMLTTRWAVVHHSPCGGSWTPSKS